MKIFYLINVKIEPLSKTGTELLLFPKNSLHKMELIAQGAEAKLYFFGDKIYKYRLPKEYRHPDLDTRLIKTRTKSEKKILSKLFNEGIPVPGVFNISTEILEFTQQNFTKFNTICMEKIEALPLKRVEITIEILEELGRVIRKVHDLNIIHGDLTTNNILYNNKIYLIDFGLSFFSTKDEDKAVDLYVFERSFRCMHGEPDHFFLGYGESEVLNRLKEVRKRGRKREMMSLG